MSEFDEMARQLIGLGAWQKLLVEHVADRAGRCKGCVDSHGGHVWPCSLARLAERAQQLAKKRASA